MLATKMFDLFCQKKKFDLSLNIFKILNFYNFLLYIIKYINGQNCVLTCVPWLIADMYFETEGVQKNTCCFKY